MTDSLQGDREKRFVFLNGHALAIVKDLEQQLAEARAEIARLKEAAAGVRRAALEDATWATIRCRYGPPSSWAEVDPPGWHLDHSCTPRDASMHDNGCVDAFKAIAALIPPEPPAAVADAQPMPDRTWVEKADGLLRSAALGLWSASENDEGWCQQRRTVCAGIEELLLSVPRAAADAQPAPDAEKEPI